MKHRAKHRGSRASRGKAPMRLIMDLDLSTFVLTLRCGHEIASNPHDSALTSKRYTYFPCPHCKR